MPSASLDDAAVVDRIGFGCCYVPQFEQPEVWGAILGARPDLFLFIGDNVYQSEENGRPELLELREAYASLAADAGFAAVRRAMPVLVTWDDHDYGMNDAGAEFPARAESQALFKHVWAVGADDPRALRDGVYHSRAAGPPGRRTQLIVLDTRYFRTAETMLGDAQWNWLEETLSQEADLRILASSIPVLTQSEEGESWHKWPAERQRLFDLIGRTGANGIVIISGDSHFGAFYRRTEDLDYALTEISSSSLNFPIPSEARPAQEPADPAKIGPRFYPANFGMISIDWESGSIELTLHHDTGTPARSESVSLSALKSAGAGPA